MGTFGTPGANVVVGGADVVLAVGTKLAPIDTADESSALLDPTRQTLIQIDVEPLNVSWTYPIDHALVGEAGYIMDRLADAISGQPAPFAPKGGGRVAAAEEPTASWTVPSSPRTRCRSPRNGRSASSRRRSRVTASSPATPARTASS